ALAAAAVHLAVLDALRDEHSVRLFAGGGFLGRGGLRLGSRGGPWLRRGGPGFGRRLGVGCGGRACGRRGGGGRGGCCRACALGPLGGCRRRGGGGRGGGRRGRGAGCERFDELRLRSDFRDRHRLLRDRLQAARRGRDLVLVD